MKKKMDYKSSGVDIAAADRATERIKNLAKSTFTPQVLKGIGSFGGFFSLKKGEYKDPVLLSSVDSVGTKLKVAFMMGKHDTVGEDIVNHCVNDILVHGAKPLFFLDYIGTGKLSPDVIAEIIKGLSRACRKAGCSLIGGETAEMPGVYAPGEFDMVGTIVGWVEKNEIVDGGNVRPGDLCLGLPSSGLHTNGYSLARTAFADVAWSTHVDELGTSLGESLLVPHRCYLKSVEKLWKMGITVKSMAHITGGGFPDNLPRVIPANVGVSVDRKAWEPQAIFRAIQERGNVELHEMYRVFNMGVGMVLILSPEDVDAAIEALKDEYPEGAPVVIGEANAWDGTGEQIRL